MNSSVLVLAQAAPESILGLAVKGGIMMIPIALCSLVGVSVVLERMSVLRRSRVVPTGFDDEFEAAMESGGPAAGADYCKSHPSPAARVLAAGIKKLALGHETVERHITSAGEIEVYQLRKRLRSLTVVAAVAPLLGLTGTIFGMIRAFQTVASSGDSLGKAELLAGGIYEAMISTAAGLLVAIPTIVLYHFLSARIEQLTRELDRVAVSFVERHGMPMPVLAGHSAGSANGSLDNQSLESQPIAASARS